MNKTLEQIEKDFRHKEFGKCKKCRKWLNYDDHFIDISEGVCGSSQGNPCAFTNDSERYHRSCFTDSITGG